MKHLQSYQEHNEGFRTGIAKAGLIGSMLVGSPDVSAQRINHDIEVSQTNDFSSSLKNVSEISNYRKNINQSKDTILSNILSKIEQNVNSNDSTKFVELYTELTTHIKSKYGYVQREKVEEMPSDIDMISMVKNMSIFEIMGWIGSISLAICGLPQAWQSYRDKHSDGISWGFLLLWGFGEIFALAYVYDKLDLPLLLNYATNILILGVILYYKVKPENKIENNDKEI